MSDYYGYLTGNRGTAIRCGSSKSGIQAHIKSWVNDVYATLISDDDGKDILILTIPECLRVTLNNKFFIVKNDDLVKDTLEKKNGKK